MITGLAGVPASARRIAVIGNGGGGKSTLTRRLSAERGLPGHHVDQEQFLPGWKPRDRDELGLVVDRWATEPAWVIDGWGPRPSIERRLAAAEVVVVVDLPLWQHFWLAAERQIAAAAGRPRVDPVAGCDDRLVTRRLFETIWHVDQNSMPWLRQTVSGLAGKVLTITDVDQLDAQ